jgi:flagellar motor switch protein FliG
MAGMTGTQIAVTLLRALPADAAEQLLSRLEPATGDRIRAQLRDSVGPPPDADLDSSLSEFFDLYRIAERGLLPPPPPPVSLIPAPPAPVPTATAADTDAVAEAEPDPIPALRELPQDKLVRALEGEPAAAVALLLSSLEKPVAAAVIKALNPEMRAEVAMRYSQPGARNHAVVQRLAKAVTARAMALPDEPPPMPADDRISDLAAMLRELPRADRIHVLLKVENTDPELATKVRAKLYKMEDLLKVEDRQLQGLLAQIDTKTLACSLKGADERVATKLSANISSRARDLLQEEIGLLGNISSQQVQAAQGELMYLFRQFEEEGKITIEE